MTEGGFDLALPIGLTRSLSLYDGHLAQRHAEAHGLDTRKVLADLSVARGAQVAEHLGALHLGGWWPTPEDDAQVLEQLETAPRAPQP